MKAELFGSPSLYSVLVAVGSQAITKYTLSCFSDKKVVWLHDIEPSQVMEKEGELPLVIKGLLFMLTCRIVKA